MPARLVSAWLTHNRGPRLAATTARLCEYAIDHPSLDVDDLADARNATHTGRPDLTSQ